MEKMRPTYTGLATPRPARAASLRLSLARGLAACAEDFTDHQGHATEDRDVVRSGQRHLQAAVDGIPRSQFVDRTDVDGDDRAAVGILFRKPERLAVRVQVVGRSGAVRQRREVLSEMRRSVASADPADAVVDIGMPLTADFR